MSPLGLKTLVLVESDRSARGPVFIRMRGNPGALECLWKGQSYFCIDAPRDRQHAVTMCLRMADSKDRIRRMVVAMFPAA